jgi:hypothetical protein
MGDTRMKAGRIMAALLAAAALSGPSTAQEQPPAHLLPPPLVGTATPQDLVAAATLGLQMERDRDPRAILAENRRLSIALADLEPHRPSTVDAYVVAVALDSDPVFAREAREAGRVLEHRYGAKGRTLVLAGADGRGGAPSPKGSPQSLAAALARVAELMDPREDVLILYTTSHGAPFGVVYNDGDQGYGAIGPTRLWSMLSRLGITNRLVLVSACYSGVFVPMLSSDTSAIVTASSADRTSFGCQSDNDWTFFGDALVNQALRKPQPLEAAAAEAQRLVAGWEGQGRLDASRPQVSIGAGARTWLAALERRLPAETPRVGRPSIASLPGVR